MQYGSVALHHAAIGGGDVETIETLINAGTNVDIANRVSKC